MTTPENQNTTQQELEPFFPPFVLFIVAAIGFFVALAVWLTQGEFNVVFWAGLVIGAIALIAWMVMNPKAVLDFVKGRGVAFGGTAIVVAIVLVIASALVYMVVDAQNWHLDYTTGNVLTIADNTREVLTDIANNPTAGNVRFVAFFDTAGAAGRERYETLFRQFEELSGGKITYEFIDPNREPLRAEPYGTNVGNGRIAVVAADETGNFLTDDVEFVSFDQYALTNKVIELLAGGDFRAIFLNVPSGVDPEDSSEVGGDFWPGVLRDTLNWTVEIISPVELTTSESLHTMAADGNVMIIAGGAEPLTDEQVNAIAEFVNQGGSLILLGGSQLTPEPTLATADNMTAFLQATYGVRIRNDFVVDSPSNFDMINRFLIVNDFVEHPVTQLAIDQGTTAVLHDPQSIEVSTSLPANVTATALMSSTAESYGKPSLDVTEFVAAGAEASPADYQRLFERAETDMAGPLPLAAAAENTGIASRLFVAGSNSLIWNLYDSSRGDANRYLLAQALFWTTGYDEFVTSLEQVGPLQEVPLDQATIDESDASYIRFVTVLLIPFGSLIIGIAIWWLRRERINA